ncbi:HNH endonuclease [Sphingobium sp.]|jgi:5-methylcytosine-specific restriction endonuclease McrA|uniref:HNH endonuclease n=1 Tax=Sphingobium sp. TaxID=1912891 RepID=UPI00257D1DD2|nr:HNH endonuclease [Sphingobium sp.]MBR2269169.1 HNH endonuclease [Sphingobium sp.]
MTHLKRCYRCDTGKPSNADYFHRDARRKDGLYAYCKSCVAKAHADAKYSRNAQNECARQRRIAADPERNKRYWAEWRDANREQTRSSAKRYRDANPEIRAVYERNRRARLRSAEGRHTLADIKNLLEEQGHLCGYCRASLDKYHTDHKQPLSRGGSNGPENLIAACPPCNLRKGTRTADEFALLNGEGEFWAKS